ncbi:hypothetical protein K443DRAFT_79544, partial [Laccaria amethystina LaAM-08-1]
MQWYATLIDKKNYHLVKYLDQFRLSATDTADVQMSSPVSDDEPQDAPSVPKTDARDRPSEYLRSRCPLCFGGMDWSKSDELVDFIVCLDACFKQKSRKAQGKEPPAPRQHPDTIFVPPSDVKVMEDIVENIRPQAKPKGKEKSRQGSSLEDADHCEPGIKVPNSVLNLCEDSFTAADEKRVKANTQFFSDTGLMAMVC